ncbi:MAG: response regulator [Acholeplasmatales bacterium]|jgi:putative two-component system response regulator|nr:response regulator [Acholeplasmatales bacterium]
MKGKKTILLCDDSLIVRATAKLSLSEYYYILEAETAEKMFLILKTASPDIILLDIMMAPMDGYEAITILKGNEKTKNIPVIFLTGNSDEESELKGLSLGAIDYITKPFSRPILLKRIETHLLIEDQKKDLLDFNNNLELKVREKTEQIRNLQEGLLRTISTLVEYRDDDTGGHIARTQNYVHLLINYLLENNIYMDVIKDWSLDFLLFSTRLHDVGKIAISDSILLKPARLTKEEFEVMKTHTTLGYEMLSQIEKSSPENDFFYHGKIFAYTHHEKFDGSGYPNGLKGQDIPLQGRLMAIADVYDALRSERPYKQGFTHAEATKILLDGRESHFDPILIDAFLALEKKFDSIANLKDKHEK